MHIPDGFLDTKTWAGLGVVSAATVAYAVRRTGRSLKEKQVPVLGVMSAFIFAAQMLNFPVVAGTSGHLLGGVLAAVLLGPWAGTLAMSTILIVQAFFFHDGGITALGANIFNMAVIGTLGSYYLARGLQFLFRRWSVTIAIAAWVSVVVDSAAAALELAFSGTSPLVVVLPAMVGIHALIGLGEAAITVSMLGLIRAARPDLLPAWLGEGTLVTRGNQS
ncbi:MAG: energy-coupling factor ABC transporter permease [Syntrophothermus sp.]